MTDANTLTLLVIGLLCLAVWGWMTVRRDGRAGLYWAVALLLPLIAAAVGARLGWWG